MSQCSITFRSDKLPVDWATLKQQHYIKIKSRKTGHRWAVGLSSQLWTIIFAMWDHRNQVLHQTGQIDALSGLGLVKQAIRTEIQRGLLTLDPLYHTYFTYTDSQITNLKSVDARNWLVLIRRAKEAKGFIYYDTIAKSAPLKKWIGLTVPKKAQQNYLALARTGYNH